MKEEAREDGPEAGGRVRVMSCDERHVTGLGMGPVKTKKCGRGRAASRGVRTTWGETPGTERQPDGQKDWTGSMV